MGINKQTQIKNTQQVERKRDKLTADFLLEKINLNGEWRNTFKILKKILLIQNSIPSRNISQK